jgi:hypothetical protein
LPGRRRAPLQIAKLVEHEQWVIGEATLFPGDAAFANPEVYEFIESEGMGSPPAPAYVAARDRTPPGK